MMKKLLYVLATFMLAAGMLLSCGGGAGGGGPDGTYFSVTYYGNGNIGGTVPVDLNKYVSGGSAVALDPGSLERTDYTFAKWTTQANGGGVSYKAGDVITMTGNVVLYAQWTSDDPGATYYTITYYGNGSTGGTAPVDLNKYVSGGSALVLGPGYLEKTDYDFVKWTTEANGGGASYNAGSSITMTGNVELYAQWTEHVSGETVYLYFGELTPTPILFSAGNYVAKEVYMEKIGSLLERSMYGLFASVLPEGTAYFGMDGLLHLDYGNPAEAKRTTLENAFQDDWAAIKNMPGIKADTELFMFDVFQYVAKIGDCTTAFYQALGMPPEFYESDPDETMGEAILIKIDQSSIDKAEVRFVIHGWASADTKLNYTSKKEEGTEYEMTTKWDLDIKAGWNEIFCRRSEGRQEFTSTSPAGVDYKWTIIPERTSNEGDGDIL